MEKRTQIAHCTGGYIVQTIRPLGAVGVSLIREAKSQIALVPVLCKPSDHSAQLVFHGQESLNPT